MDELNPNYIFQINCREINIEPSYVFKISDLALQLALKMDPEIQNDKPSSMVEEYAHLDGMHTRVKGYVTLALWTYHPGLCKVMRLASMECKCGNTLCITLFLDLFNKPLQKKTGNPQYKFNPAGFMVNESGANFNAIEKVLGKDVAKCTVTCHWHFMSCGRNHIKDINMNERETFETLYQKICYTYTRHDYHKTTESLQTICTWNGIANWWQWWEVWHFHIVPTFWGFNLSGLSLAEVGNSSIRNKTRLPMSLVVAAWKDMLHMLLQDRDYEAFLTNTGKVSGSGLNLKQRRAKF